MGAEPVDPTLVVRECIATLAADIEARRMRVELPELPVVAGNAVLLTAVFRNLLVNAIEHGSGRRREIRVFAERDDARWRIAVDSPGPPISEDDHTVLFEVPWRGAGRRGARGGCGLVLVRGIVERHGGRSGSCRPTTERTGSSSGCPPRARVRHARRAHAEPPRRPRPATARRACGGYA